MLEKRQAHLAAYIPSIEAAEFGKCAGPGLSSTPPTQTPIAWGPRVGETTMMQSPRSYPPRSDIEKPKAEAASAWGQHQQGSLASRIAEAEASRDQGGKEQRGSELTGGKGKKASKQLVVLGMQNRRY